METPEKVKRAAPQQRGMQIDAQLQHGESSVPATGDDVVPPAVRDDANMVEELDDGWLQKETAEGQHDNPSFSFAPMERRKSY